MTPEEVFDADNALLEDVLKGNGEEHLFKKMVELAVDAEDYPPMIFAWQNVEVFVQAIQAAQEQAASPGGVPLPPDPLCLSAGVNVQNFKEAVLEYARAPENPARLGTTCLPCSSSASLGYVGGLCLLTSTMSLGSSASWPSECQIRFRLHTSTCLKLVRVF
ncbi:hypothetical protein MHU86_21884 [Fragilaria crotonensis]|nr:hypothetical protein MHU86_21884 [Fragilaria crotonensis]